MPHAVWDAILALIRPSLCSLLSLLYVAFISCFFLGFFLCALYVLIRRRMSPFSILRLLSISSSVNPWALSCPSASKYISSNIFITCKLSLLLCYILRYSNPIGCG